MQPIASQDPFASKFCCARPRTGALWVHRDRSRRPNETRGPSGPIAPTLRARSFNDRNATTPLSLPQCRHDVVAPSSHWPVHWDCDETTPSKEGGGSSHRCRPLTRAPHLVARSEQERFEDQAAFIAWWGGSVSIHHGAGRGKKSAERGTFSLADAEASTGISNQQVSRRRAKPRRSAALRRPHG
jgi:hypothetical protein